MAHGSQESTLRTWLSERYAGTYADGRRCDEIGYLQCKLILKPDRFTSAKVFKEFAGLVQEAAEKTGVGFHPTPKSLQRPEVREVLFLDTGAYHLYNNAFIMRRRIAYQDGFPIDDPEIVFKYRSEDMQRAQLLDVRPRIDGKYKVKFKLEVMPLKDRVGGLRRLLSHNVEFGLSQAPAASRLAMASLGRLTLEELAAIFPALAGIPIEGPGEVSMVNQTVVEELLQDICELSFHHHTAATANLALWRSRGDHHGFVGEFAYQLRFRDPDELRPESIAACEAFFIELQHVAADWLALTSTKTGAVYRLKGNPPQAHE
ncbi:MAG: hypothetical protein JSR24_19270 [Proteobacteria bacterium]|nr:hypothetical protein [Pseudomonadota bacterium]